MYPTTMLNVAVNYREHDVEIISTYPSVVYHVVKHGDVLLEVDGEQLRSRITHDACEELNLSAGQNVFVLIKSVALESTLLG